VGLVSQYVAFFVFNAAMAMSGVARVGQLMLLQPFVILGLAALVNGESARPTMFAHAVQYWRQYSSVNGCRFSDTRTSLEAPNRIDDEIDTLTASRHCVATRCRG
jgi:hypothetical protein